MRAIGLDLGGSFIKSAVLDLASCQLRHVASTPFPAFASAGAGHRELDPEALWHAAIAHITRLLALEPGCEAVFLCGQMHGLVLVDAAGRALGPAVTWQDTRTLDGSHARLLAALPDAEALGGELGPGYPLSVLHWLAERGELVAGAVPQAIAGYVAARLVGDAAWTDPSNASAMGAYDIQAGDWHRPTLAALGLAGLAWQAIAPPGALVGTAHVAGATLAVHAPLGDQQAALAGALLAPGELSLNVGTGSQVSVLAPPTPGPYQRRPYLEGTLRTVTHLPAGRALNVLFGLVTELGGGADAWARIDAASQTAAPNRLHADLAFFPCRVGEMGAFTGIQEGHFGVGELFGSAFDAMARNYQQAAASLGGSPSGVAVSGGLAHRLGALRQRLEAAFPLPFRFSPCPEETLVGLIALALVARGLAGSHAEARERLRALPPNHPWIRLEGP